MSLNLLVLGVYFWAIYFVAAWAQKRGSRESATVRVCVYALSLFLYQGSWIYLTSVGVASGYGWNYLADYVGPVAAITLLFPVWRRIARIVKHENIGSIADFLSSRYGKSRTLGSLVACAVVIATLPALAGQLRSLLFAWPQMPDASMANYAVGLMILATLLIAFAITFGLRKPALTDHNHGLVHMVAFDSIFKVAMLGAMAVLATIVLLSKFDFRALPAHFGHLSEPLRLDGGLLNSILLGVTVMFCSPRQFYLAFVELENERDLHATRWVLMALWMFVSICAIPIVVAGDSIFHGAPTETYLLLLVKQYGGNFLNALMLTALFSCVSVFVTVELVALSSMVSNELVLPIVARLGWRGKSESNIGRTILCIRYVVAASLMMLSVLICLAARSRISLFAQTTASGLAQLMPMLIGGLYWRRGSATGAIAGLSAGLIVWLYYIAGPLFIDSIVFSAPVTIHLATASGTNYLVERVLLALLTNTALYVGISLCVRPSVIDRIQASLFIDPFRELSLAPTAITPHGTVRTLKSLVAQFVGSDAAEATFDNLSATAGRQIRDGDPIDVGLLRASERILAAVIGASLARNVLNWQLSDHGREPGDVIRVLDDAAQAVQFNRQLLDVTLANLTQGVYVIDRNGLLEMWNARCPDILGLAPGYLHVGRPANFILQEIAERNGLSPEAATSYVRKTLDCICRKVSYEDEHEYRGRRIVRSVGSPLPDGHYLTCLSDVTDLRLAASSLQQSNEELERSVVLRTAELTEANIQLADAKAEAERAAITQARFLAAASHDLLQPLQAARLFLGALREDLSERNIDRQLVQNADISVESANRLLRALLNLSRLEIGGVKPDLRPVDVAGLLGALDQEFGPLAQSKGLRLRILSRQEWVRSDPDLLRSVLQNLISNAIRYTISGSVLVVCRNCASGLRFEVRDSGPGIPETALGEIFREYSRLQNATLADAGAGLGLSIVERICRLLGHPISVRSRLGKGSIFTVNAARAPAVRGLEVASSIFDQLSGMRILYVENDPYIIEGMKSLVSRWGGVVHGATGAAEALAASGPWDAVLLDYGLGEERTGLDLVEQLRSQTNILALITAEADEAVAQRAAALNVELFIKPVAPASLRAFLTRGRNLDRAAE